MPRRHGIRIFVVSIGMSVCQLASAVPITGSFAGLAEGWRILEYGGGQVPFANEPATGTFAFETEFDGADVYPDANSVGFFGWPTRVTVDLFGSQRVFENEDQGFTHALLLSEGAGEQVAELYYFAAYANASFRFVAPGGGLFTDFNPATLNPAAISVAASTANFSATRAAKASACVSLTCDLTVSNRILYRSPQRSRYSASDCSASPSRDVASR